MPTLAPPQPIEQLLPPDDPAPDSSPGAADASDAARFSEVMDAPDAAAGAEDAASVQATAPSSGRTLGDNILGGLHRLSTDLQQTWKSMGAALGGTAAAPNMRDLLKVQMNLASMSVQYELVSKAVSRATQNIDQLVKLQ
jgi:type III secretion protein I